MNMTVFISKKDKDDDESFFSGVRVPDHTAHRTRTTLLDILDRQL